ncbi:MAG: ABC transporter permease [Armatimonadota bacterium]|nr:ABC transporter permease [Armatimonadota bacterium]
MLVRKAITIREINILLVLVALVAFIHWQKAEFLDSYNIRTVLKDFSIYALLAIGETLVILVGGIDLSPGAMVALTGFLTAHAMANKGLPMEASIGLVLLLALAIGYIHGLFVTKLGVAPFIITLGTFIIARAAASIPTHGTPVSNLPDSFSNIAGAYIGPIPVPAIILLFFAIIAVLITQYTALGRDLYAIGGNIEASRLAGINVDRRRIFCYMASTFLAGVAGIIVASRISLGDPGVGSNYELTAISAVVIGGTSLMGGEGTIFGTLLGGAIMSVLANGFVLLEVDPYWQPICIGAVVVIAVTLDSVRRRRKAASRRIVS